MFVRNYIGSSDSYGIWLSRKMFEAIFHILKDADSLDLIIESYQLLIELDKVLHHFTFYVNMSA